MIERRLSLFAGAALAAAGCSTLAGIDDIALTDQAPALPEPEPDATTAVASARDDDDDSTSAAMESDASLDASFDATDAGRDAADADASDADDPPSARCTATDFAANDRRDPAASRTIAFPAGPGYDPRCIRIRRGQSVTFVGDLAAHPLAPRGPTPAPSPIVATGAGASVTFTFAARGRFRYASPGTPGMRGAVDVRP